MLQSKNINIVDAQLALTKLLEYIENYRSHGFESLLETSKELSNILNISPNFNSSNNIRIRKPKKILNVNMKIKLLKIQKYYLK